MNKLRPLILWILLSVWTVSAQRVYAGQSIEEILALPEERIAADHAYLVLRNPPDCPLRLALITARSSPAHERVLKTLRAWQARIDEMFFLGGVSKDEVLRAFQPHIFFDDRDAHCLPAARVAPTAQILSDSWRVLRREHHGDTRWSAKNKVRLGGNCCL